MATKEGCSWEGVEMMGSKTSPTSSDISSSLNIMAGFLSCRNASTDMQSWRDFSNENLTPKHAQQGQGGVKSKGPKTCHPSMTPKGDAGVRDPGLQEQCKQVMHQNDAITAAFSPVKPPLSKPETREGELEPSVALVPVPSMPMSPNYLQLAMDQCGLRFNEWGELVPTNTESPYRFLPTTIGFQTTKAMSGSLDLGVAEELHCTLVAWLRGEMGGTGSLSLLTATTFSLSPSLGLGFCSNSCPMTLAMPSTLLGAAKSNSPQVLLLWTCVFENWLYCLLCMYVGVMFSVQILLQTQKGKCFALLIPSYGWRVECRLSRRDSSSRQRMGCLTWWGKFMSLVQTVKCSPEEEQRLAALQEDQLMIKAEALWRRIAEAQQGIDIQESAPKDSEQGATKRVGHHQTQGSTKAPPSLPTPSLVTSKTMTVGLESKSLQSMPEGDTNQREDASTSSMSKYSPEKRDRSIPRRCQGQGQRVLLLAEKTKQAIAIQTAPLKWIKLYRERLCQMGDSVTLRKTELAEVRVMDATWEEIAALVGQLVSLKHSYKGWRNVVTLATFPGQHQMTEGDPQVGLETLDLV